MTLPLPEIRQGAAPSQRTDEKGTKLKGAPEHRSLL